MEKGRENRPGLGKNLKEAYVSPDDMDEKAASWMETIRPYARHPFERTRLGKIPALLVMDMQRFFLDSDSGAHLPAGAAILPVVRDLILAFREKNHPVIFTKHVDRPGDTRGSMYRWWNRLMQPDDPMVELHPDLPCGPRDIMTVKRHYSAFMGTRLEVLLTQLRVSCTVIAGVMTHLCCESTARDAFMRGFDVVAVVDGTATLNELLHLSSLRGLVHGFAAPALAKDVKGGLGG